LEEAFYYRRLHEGGETSKIRKPDRIDADRYIKDGIDFYRYISQKIKAENLSESYQKDLQIFFAKVIRLNKNSNPYIYEKLNRFLEGSIPKISVLIPVYQGEKYLRRCLESLVVQSFQEFEVVMINDGSTDGSQKIIDEYCRKYENFKAVYQSNQGIIRARARGLSECRGEYIMNMDNDDYLHPEALGKLAEHSRLTQADLIHFDYFKVDGFKNDQISYFRSHRNTSPIWCKLVKAQLFQKVAYDELPPISYYEDHLVTLLLNLNAQKVAYLEAGLYYHYRHSESTWLTFLRSCREKGSPCQFSEGENVKCYNEMCVSYKSDLTICDRVASQLIEVYVYLEKRLEAGEWRQMSRADFQNWFEKRRDGLEKFPHIYRTLNDFFEKRGD
jgi:glycosyltransferase involved in cell wall biosynthesis